LAGARPLGGVAALGDLLAGVLLLVTGGPVRVVLSRVGVISSAPSKIRNIMGIPIGRVYASAYNNRGLAYDDLKKYEQAIADFTAAIRLKPDYAGAQIRRSS
jgi:tetratricopeptide (TPR) repeat protein